MKESIWKGVAAVALVIAVLGVFTPQVREAVKEVGEEVAGAIGTRFPNGLAIGSGAEVNLAGETVVKEFTQGGGCTTLTDANGGTYTLTQAEMASANCLVFAAGGAGQEVITLQLPATSTLTTLLPDTGDFREWIYDASALAAATTTTVTAGAGMDLIGVTTNDDVIDGAEWARLSCWRQADTDVTCITSELLHVD